MTARHCLSIFQHIYFFMCNTIAIINLFLLHRFSCMYILRLRQPCCLPRYNTRLYNIHIVLTMQVLDTLKGTSGAQGTQGIKVSERIIYYSFMSKDKHFKTKI